MDPLNKSIGLRLAPSQGLGAAFQTHFGKEILKFAARYDHPGSIDERERVDEGHTCGVAPFVRVCRNLTSNPTNLAARKSIENHRRKCKDQPTHKAQSCRRVARAERPKVPVQLPLFAGVMKIHRNQKGSQ